MKIVINKHGQIGIEVKELFAELGRTILGIEELKTKILDLNFCFSAREETEASKDEEVDVYVQDLLDEHLSFPYPVREKIILSIMKKVKEYFPTKDVWCAFA